MAQAVIGPVSRWHDSGIVGVGPGLWYGPTALDGAAGDWKRAPLGSIYVQVDASGTATSTWQKVARNGATADWKKLAINAATDTLTAGVIKPAADGATAIKLQNAAGAADALVVNTTTKSVSIGDTFLSALAVLEVPGTRSAQLGYGLIVQINGTVVAAANNDLLAALYISPAFTPGAFTGVKQYGIYDTSSLSYFAGSIELKEMAAPGAGAANTARLYAVDNGAGKTQLMVQFATGTPIQIAIEA